MTDNLAPGLYETIVTEALERRLSELDARVVRREQLRPAEAADRIAHVLAQQIIRALETVGEDERARVGVEIARQVAAVLEERLPRAGAAVDHLLSPGEMLAAIGELQPDASVRVPATPLIPLLDTTLLTNAHGEPSLRHQIQREIESADRIDVVMAFVRKTGVRPLLDALRNHVENGRSLRVLTTTYTGSTEAAALDQLVDLGAEVKISYDNSTARLHAKSWLFHRTSAFSTAYVGSSNLTFSAHNAGKEWNVRLSEARNPDVIKKIDLVFEAYWNSIDFVSYEPEEFKVALARQGESNRARQILFRPLEVHLKPFQERLLELIEISRSQGYHRNLLVAATGTGKTVMAAKFYQRLGKHRPRLLFVAHRREILEQSRHTFQQVLDDYNFGDLWVGDDRPTNFNHVFASIQILSKERLNSLAKDSFDVVIVDEFHHAAAESYDRLLRHVEPAELLGLTATPERPDGQPILHWFGDRIAAELRLWDAIEQHRLTPFEYFGINDDIDLRDIPWRRGRGYDDQALSRQYMADARWARLVADQLNRHVDDVTSMRCLGFCVTVEHAHYMAQQFRELLGIAAVAISGATPGNERAIALKNLAAGNVQVIFSVDVFNEGVDVPTVDTILMLRPTESATLFLQQLGRGLRLSEGKSVCTILDFIGNHHKDFRFDLRYRALLGGTRSDIERAVADDFPFVPPGCLMHLDRVSQEVVLRSIKTAIPSRWPEKVAELRRLHKERGDVSLSQFLTETGLELADIYASNRSWSDLRATAGLPIKDPGPSEVGLRRAVGRLLHVEDSERIDGYRDLLDSSIAPVADDLGLRDRRVLRMLTASLASQFLTKQSSLQDAVDLVWTHPQVMVEVRDLLSVLHGTDSHLHQHVRADIPLQVHSRYTRIEILAAVDDDDRGKPRDWREGVLDAKSIGTDLLIFTLDKTGGQFSPTTRYRDYAISPELIHWESQSTTTADSPTGRRYQDHAAMDRSVWLFARERQDDRSFWFLGPADYVQHEGERPMAITWRLRTPLSGDLYAAFAAAVA